jgi:hypothetical protein
VEKPTKKKSEGSMQKGGGGERRERRKQTDQPGTQRENRKKSLTRGRQIWRQSRQKTAQKCGKQHMDRME